MGLRNLPSCELGNREKRVSKATPFGRESRVGKAPTFMQPDLCQIRGERVTGRVFFLRDRPRKPVYKWIPRGPTPRKKAPEGEGLYENIQPAGKEDEDLNKTPSQQEKRKKTSIKPLVGDSQGEKTLKTKPKVGTMESSGSQPC